MATFDQFANQGGPAAWDPEYHDDSRERADELIRNLYRGFDPDQESSPGESSGDGNAGDAQPNTGVSGEER